MWDKSEDKSDAEFQSLLAAQKAVTTAEEDYQKVLETTNRTIEDAQRAVELDKYKGSDSSSKDKLTDLKEHNLIVCINEDAHKGRLYRLTDEGKNVVSMIGEMGW